MTDLLVTLMGGILLISSVFLLIYKFTRFAGKQTAVITALLVIAVYMPIVIIRWPGADVFAIHFALYLVTVYILGIVTSQRDARRRETEGPLGWFHWAPAAIVIFFMVVVSVNSIFIFLAQKGVDREVANWLLPKPTSGGKVSSYFPGTVVQDFVDKDGTLNKYQQKIKTQLQRDWRIQKGFVGEARSGQRAVFKLRAFDNANHPVSGAKVIGKFMRPGNSKLDIGFQMHELDDAKGNYVIEVVFPEPGNWHLSLRIERGDEQHDINARTTVAVDETS